MVAMEIKMHLRARELVTVIYHTCFESGSIEVCAEQERCLCTYPLQDTMQLHC